jgi:hypothetical protein
MKTKLLRKFRKRFKFTDIHGYWEMLDKHTNIIYGPEWGYCRSRYSVKEYLYFKAIALLIGNEYWKSDRLLKKSKRRRLFHIKQIKSA